MPTPNAAPAQADKWYSIRPTARAGVNAAAGAAEILIYGDIGDSWYGDTIAAGDFVREVGALDVTDLTVRINSYGGSVTDGIAIHNALKRHKASVTTVVDGIAASIASLIAMAGDRVEMAENALLMIHAPWMYAEGNSAALRDQADMLDTYANAMATSYAAKTGGDQAAILALLTDGKDHWYTAAEALAEKFTDATIAALPIAASAGLNKSIKARFASFPLLNTPAASAAPIPLTPKENTTMPGSNPAASADPVAAAENAKIAAAAVLAADKARRNGISASFAKFTAVAGVPELLTTCADDHDCTVEAAGARLLAHLGKDSAPVAGSYIVTLEDSRDKFRAAAAASIMARGALAKDDGANNYRGYSLMDVARECLAHTGANVKGMTKLQLVAAAFTHTGSDFPLLLSNVAEKAMMKGYEEAEETFQLWTSRGTLGDFKPGSRVDLNSFPGLDRVREGAEYKYATIGERGETVQLATYGKLFSLTRQAIINDDLDAFTKIPRRMGDAAIRTIGDLVYAILNSNLAMSDGIPLFDAAHKNILTAAGINTASVDAMRVAMRLQTVDAKTPLNIRLAKLLVPAALEGIANTVRDSEFDIGAGSRNNTVPNSVRGTFEVISDARLDMASSTTWYATADSARHDTVEVSYLDGNSAPTLEQQDGWTIDGTDFKVRIDAGVKALDYRTLARTTV